MAGPPLGCGCSLARLHPVRVGVTHAHQAHQSTSSCPSSRSEEKEGWPLGHHEVGAGVSPFQPGGGARVPGLPRIPPSTLHSTPRSTPHSTPHSQGPDQ